MRIIKNIAVSAVMLLSMCIGLSGCGSADSNTSSSGATNQAGAQQTKTETTDNTQISGKDTIVIYFSATGTTEGVAKRIANVTDADIYEIIPAEPYSDADLDWNDKSSRTTKEQNDPSVRPEIASEKLDLSGYTRIYIGFPIWWGEEPRIMDTFVESYDFGDTVMIPFCTSGGSGIGHSGKNLESNAESGNWLDGDRLDAGISEDELKRWINGLN